MASTPLRRDRPARRHRLPRAVLIPLIIVGCLAGLILVIRLVLDPIATHQTRKALNQMEGMRGDFERVHVSIFSPAYTITRLKVMTRGGSEKDPLFYVDRAHVGVSWRELLHGRLVASLRLDEPKISILQQEAEEKAPEAKEAAAKAPDISRQLRKLTALKVDRIEIFRGEILFRNGRGDRAQQLWVHRLDLAAQNLATRAPLAGGRPATVSAHGTVGRSGDLTLFVSADPFARPLSFAGQCSVTGLRATELYEFIEPKTDMKASKGTIDMFVEFVSKDGLITGGVKPVLKNIEIRPSESGIWDRMKAWAADKSIELTSDRVPGRNAVATTVPIKGKLGSPDIQLWPAVLGVIRNAFVTGLASGFGNLPPDTSQKKEGVLEQAKDALKKDAGPPKAQPVTKP